MNDIERISVVRLDMEDVYIEHLDEFKPVKITEPKGDYTTDPEGVYAGHTYRLLLKLRNHDPDTSDTFKVVTKNGKAKEVRYDTDLEGVVVDLVINPSAIPLLKENQLPGSLWSEVTLQLYINDIPVKSTSGDVVSLPVSFDPCVGTMDGESFFNSEQAILIVQPGEHVILDISSGGGGGAGVNFVKGENKSGKDGGDATLCYMEPETGLIKPIVFLEGGLGGKMSANALQEFKKREGKVAILNEDWVTPHVYIDVLYVLDQNPAANSLESSAGGIAQETMLATTVSAGGKGGMKGDLGFRGEGGMSGARAIMQITNHVIDGVVPGPFLIIHPKTKVNIFEVIKDTDLKIKKTKKPMLGGAGGVSATVAGEDGQNGTLIVSVCNG